MESARRAIALVATLFLLTHCSHKTPPVAADDAGAPAPPPAPTAPPGPPSLASFEGEIDLVAKSADASKPPQSVNLLVRNDRLRLDALPGTDTAKFLGGKAFLLVRVPDKKVDVVVEANKQVIELDLNNTERLKNLAKGAGSRPNSKGEPRATEPPPKIVKTGQKETIAGYSCEDWDVTSTKDNKKKASLCVADVPVSFFHLPLTDVPVEYAPMLELIDGEHMPLRVVAYDDKTGAESGRLEVTKFDRHPLDASLFEVPPGYAVVDAMQMIAAFAGGGRVPGMPSGMPVIPGAPPGGLPGAPGHHKKHH
jgi:hypothetical protein